MDKNPYVKSEIIILIKQTLSLYLSTLSTSYEFGLLSFLITLTYPRSIKIWAIVLSQLSSTNKSIFMGYSISLVFSNRNLNILSLGANDRKPCTASNENWPWPSPSKKIKNGNYNRDWCKKIQTGPKLGS